MCRHLAYNGARKTVCHGGGKFREAARCRSEHTRSAQSGCHLANINRIHPATPEII
jgi:hypothetical protein